MEMGKILWIHLHVALLGRGVAVSARCSFGKGEFLVEYRGQLKSDDDLPAVDTYVYEFNFRGKSLW